MIDLIGKQVKTLTEFHDLGSANAPEVLKGTMGVVLEVDDNHEWCGEIYDMVLVKFERYGVFENIWVSKTLIEVI